MTAAIAATIAAPPMRRFLRYGQGGYLAVTHLRASLSLGSRTYLKIV